MQTIAAAATPLSSAGAVAVIRMSGDNSLDIARKIFSSEKLDFDRIEPRKMYLGTIKGDNFMDKAFCVYYKAPKSYTGEDMIEFQIHGGLALAKGLLKLLFDMGARPAQAGEFSKRAFLNGKMTLSEAEGVADIINAESQAQALQAYRMLSGELSKGILECENLILKADAALEAALDYPDELLEDAKGPVPEYLRQAKAILEELIEGSKNRSYITEGVTVAITGLTNVGKSSLMNALLKEDRAIVTDIAGTTRDVLKDSVEINGVKVNFIDTAGIRDSADVIESIGVERAKRAVDSADLALFVIDLSEPETEEEKSLKKTLQGKNIITVANKGDKPLYIRESDIVIEAKNRKNIDTLIDMIIQKLDLDSAVKGAVLTRERHVFAVKEALSAIDSALENYDLVTPDCTLVDIKTAHRAVAAITGNDVEESVVDRIFADFCVGK